LYYFVLNYDVNVSPSAATHDDILTVACRCAPSCLC